MRGARGAWWKFRPHTIFAAKSRTTAAALDFALTSSARFVIRNLQHAACRTEFHDDPARKTHSAARRPVPTTDIQAMISRVAVGH